MLEGVENLFESEGISRLAVGYFPDVSVRAGANFLGESVACEDVRLNFLGHFLCALDLNIIL